MDLLLLFDWPGNVRELENEMERAVALARDGESLDTSHFSAKLHGIAPSATPRREGQLPGAEAARALPVVEGGEPAATSLRQARAAFEARYVAEALRQHDGNVSRTAQALGLSRVMLHKKMKEYGIR